MSDLFLIIDMQEGFRSKQTDAILPAIQTLRPYFKDTTIYTQFINETGSFFEKQLAWTSFQNTKEQAILHELNAPKDQIISHTSYTVLNNDLIDLIQKKQINHVYLSGVYTDVCITKTAMDLFDNQIECSIIKDACHSLHGQENHDQTIDSLSHIIGKQHIIQTKDITEKKT